MSTTVDVAPGSASNADCRGRHQMDETKIRPLAQTPDPPESVRVKILGLGGLRTRTKVLFFPRPHPSVPLTPYLRDCQRGRRDVEPASRPACNKRAAAAGAP